MSQPFEPSGKNKGDWCQTCKSEVTRFCAWCGGYLEDDAYYDQLLKEATKGGEIPKV